MSSTQKADASVEMTFNAPTIYGHIDYHFPDRLSYDHAKNGPKVLMIDGEFNNYVAYLQC